MPAGLPLGLSWSRSPLGCAFIWTNIIPKIAAVGALYLMAVAWHLSLFYFVTFGGFIFFANYQEAKEQRFKVQASERPGNQGS